MYGIIYLVTNKVNQKVYVGQTVRTLEARQYRHFQSAGYGSDTYFHRALRQYGKENFEWSVLDQAVSRSELNKKERHWIKFYKATNSQYGYNLTFGGEGGIPTEETRLRLSLAHIGKPNGCLGHKHSEETKEKIRQALKDNPKVIARNKRHSEIMRGRPSSFKGKHHTSEAKEKLSAASKEWWKKMGVSARKAAAIKRSKLTEEDIIEIRKRTENGERHSKIAALYGVSLTVVSNIKNKKRWAWIK